MDLYENLKESYKPASEAKQNIAGYQLDNELSDINHKVYFNKDKDRDNRLLVMLKRFWRFPFELKELIGK